MLTAFKYKGRIIYVESENDAVVYNIKGAHMYQDPHYAVANFRVVHFVAERHWDDYLAKRTQVPRLVVIFDKVFDRDVELGI